MDFSDGTGQNIHAKNLQFSTFFSKYYCVVLMNKLESSKIRFALNSKFFNPNIILLKNML
jgi:hypothetical protein